MVKSRCFLIFNIFLEKKMKIYDFKGKKNICGSRVREAREQRKMTQTKLATQLQIYGVEIECNSISRIEAGTRFVSDYEIVALSKCLNVTPNWLLNLEN